MNDKHKELMASDLTLREILACMLIKTNYSKIIHESSADEFSFEIKSAFEVADAMIERRGKTWHDR